MEKEWIFCVTERKDWDYDGDKEIIVPIISVTEKDYFDENGCCQDYVDDEVYEVLGEDYFEEMESVFVHSLTSTQTEEIIEDLEDRGFTYSSELENFIKSLDEEGEE